jgi:hypothetical protein
MTPLALRIVHQQESPIFNGSKYHGKNDDFPDSINPLISGWWFGT